MVVLEVSQITLRNWTIRDELCADIYLEVYFERNVVSCGCCGRRRRQKHKSFRPFTEIRTDPVCEAGEMMWRKYNEERFLLGLFKLDGQAWRASRTGEGITIMVDIRRVVRGTTLQPGEKGELVQVMEAPIMLGGNGGHVTLKPTDRQGIDPCADESDLPVVTMEFRPRSVRPFMLELAKPDNSFHEDLSRKKRMSMSTISHDTSLLTDSSSSFSSRGKSAKALWLRGAAGSVPESVKESSLQIPRERPPSRRGRELLGPGDSPPAASERTSDNNSSAGNRSRHRGSGNDERGGAADRRPSSAASKSSGEQDKQPVRSASFDLANSDAQREDSGAARMIFGEEGRSHSFERVRAHEGLGDRGSQRSFSSSSKRFKAIDLSSCVRQLVRRNIKKTDDKTRTLLPKVYTPWIPLDWETFWQSPWPSEDDMLENIDVVPLMEEEFRRDCVIFFNTLFPNTQASMFQILKQLAFDPGGSKVSFRLLSDKRGEGNTRSLDTNSITNSFIDAGEDERRITEESNFPRLSTRAFEAMRFFNKRVSRSRNSSASASGSGEKLGRLGSARCPLRLLHCLFGRSDAPAESPKAPATGSTSPTKRRSFEDHGVGSNSCNGEEDSRSPGAADNLSVATLSIALGDVLGLDADTTPREMGRSSSNFVNFQTMGKQQPCMCTLTTPKGIFVDEYTPRIMLLKRVLLCFAICGIYYSEVSNCSQLAELWPYPLASVLGHGSRVLIRLEDVEASEFINFLLFGDPLCVDWKEDGLPYPLTRRLAATHTVQLDPVTGNLVERKLQVMSASDTVQNITDGMRRKHLGLNLPIGGVGNPSPLGREHYIDFTGHVVQKREYRDRYTSLMVGLGWRSEESRGWTRRRGRESNASFCMDLQRPDDIGEPESPSNVGREESSPMATSSTKPFTRTGSMASTSTLDDRCSTTSIPSPQAKQSRRRMRLLSAVQGGHLYIRTDDFGDQISRGGNEGGAFGRRSEVGRLLRKKPRGYNLVYEQAKLRARLGPGCIDCGELFFSNSVPEIRRRRHGAMRRDHCGNMTLLRMCSEPCLNTAGFSANDKDIAWVKEAIDTVSKLPLKAPPSPLALRLLLEHFDPTNVQLYGRGGFKSIEELWGELCAQRSFLMKGANMSLQRYVEPLVLQLRWKGYTLMSTHEAYQDSMTGNWRTVPRNGFISVAMRPDEHWEKVIHRIMLSEFHVSNVGLQTLLNPRSEAVVHKVFEETLDSPSYPGMSSYYTSHMVVWDLKDYTGEALSPLGLPFDTVERDGKYRQEEKVPSDFNTSRQSTRKRFYSWVPERLSQELQRFLNMEMQTADDRWAKYAFEAQGVVQYPPTEEALTTLLRRCGIDVRAYGRHQHRSVGAFWLELLNQESYLMMDHGQPHRIVESLFVKVRWRGHRRAGAGRNSHGSNAGSANAEKQMVLVKTVHTRYWRESVMTEGSNLTETRPEDPGDVLYTLFNTRKFREETWEDSMIRCVKKELGLTKPQFKSIYDRQPADEEGRYAFYDVVRQSKSFPGVLTLYRTHLVTINLKEDYASILGPAAFTHDTAGRLPPPPWDDHARSASKKSTSPRRADSISHRWSGREPSPNSARDSSHNSQSFMDVVRESRAAGGLSHETSYVWVPEDGSGQISLEEARGTDLWVEARKREEKHKVASVLIGLEGTAPQRKSPFGAEHDASGTSAKVSATGGRKWRAYGMNNALQIPSDYGGIHVKITRPMFQEFMSTCETLSLVDPSEDLEPDEDKVYSREDLERRYTEKELFKQILSGNGFQAHEAVELMKEYCSQLRAPTQAYNAIHRSRCGSMAQEPLEIPARVDVAPTSGDIINV